VVALRSRDEVRLLQERGYVFTVYWDRDDRIAEITALVRMGHKESGASWVRGAVHGDTLRRIFRALEDLRVPDESVEALY